MQVLWYRVWCKSGARWATLKTEMGSDGMMERWNDGGKKPKSWKIERRKITRNPKTVSESWKITRLDFLRSLVSGLPSLRRWLQPTFPCLSDWCYFDSALQMALEIIGTHPVTSVLDILLWFVEPIKGRFPKKMFGNTTTPRIKIGLQCVLMVLWLVLFH